MMNKNRLSNKMKQKYLQAETKMLEEQTKRMEEKLSILKQQVQQQKQLKASKNYQSTITRWRKNTNTGAPLKDYAKKILADQKQAYNKYGISQKKVLGTKSFQPLISKIKQEKSSNEDRSGLKIPSLEVTQQLSEEPSSIQNNFFKAKIETKNIIKRKSLEQFMEENYLQQYTPILKEAQICQLEDLYHTEKSKLGELGIKPGHQAKIIKKLKEQFEEKKQPEEVQKSEQTTNKVQFGYGDGNVLEYQNIQQQNQNSYPEEQQQSEEDAEEYDDHVNMITIPNFAETSLQTGNDENQEQKCEEYNCFQCYKKSTNSPQVSSDNRLFCSLPCLNKYLQYMQKKCPECENIFYKFEGYFEDGLWFCSLACSPKRDKIEEMFIEWSKT